MIIGAILATWLAIVQEPYSARFGAILGNITGRNKRSLIASQLSSSALQEGKDETDVAVSQKAAYDPEIRLYFACIESALLPIGLFWLGWSQFSYVHWVVPCFGIGLATMGIYSVYLATFNYLADVYHRYASSALAAQSFCRNVVGAVFPLISSPLFNHLGFAQASSLLGGIVSCTSCPLSTSCATISIPCMLLTPTLGNRPNSCPLGPRRLRPINPATLEIRQRDHVISSERILPPQDTNISVQTKHSRNALRNT
jgi:hypothetical protein